MLTAEKLKSYTAKDLGQMAKSQGVAGWHGMRKDQLVRALLKTNKPSRSSRSASAAKKSVARRSKSSSASKPSGAVKPASRRSSRPDGARSSAKTNGTPVRTKAASKTIASKASKNGASKNGKNSVAQTNGKAPGKKKSAPKAAPQPTSQQRAARTRAINRLKKEVDQQRRSKDLSHGNNGTHQRDRLAVMVRDPYWLHAYWELSRAGVQRAEAALGREWHDAHPILRLYEVLDSGSTSSAERIVEDIAIHGGVNNWYVPVMDPPKSYRLEVGYLSHEDRFFSLARSNVVTTPRAGATDAIDQNWTDVAENVDKIYAMSGGYSAEGASAELQELFEERLRRPMGSPMVPRFNGNNGHGDEFTFDVDAELIVYGKTETNASVTLASEPVRLRPDGTFTMRFRLPNCRQVIPAVACSADGVEQRTIVLAVERNTKFLEPIIRDAND